MLDLFNQRVGVLGEQQSMVMAFGWCLIVGCCFSSFDHVFSYL